MEAITLKTDLHCGNCISKIEPILKEDVSVSEYKIDLDHPEKLVTIKGNGIDRESIISKIKNSGYMATPYEGSQTYSFPEMKLSVNSFWKNNKNWKRASFNTLNCLIGCSIGDFGMLLFLQAFYPGTPLYLQMILAIIAGLVTSVALETTLLRVREEFDWSNAFRTALSMSFISMVGMEIAMNATDFMITGGKAAFDSAGYWLALIPALIAGFVLPLPYNYYKLQKFNKSCH